MIQLTAEGRGKHEPLSGGKEWVISHPLVAASEEQSKVALRDAVTRPSKRLSSWELHNLADKGGALKAELDRQRANEQAGQREKAYER
jgi:hypothetical protein